MVAHTTCWDDLSAICWLDDTDPVFEAVAHRRVAVHDGVDHGDLLLVCLLVGSQAVQAVKAAQEAIEGLEVHLADDAGLDEIG